MDLLATPLAGADADDRTGFEPIHQWGELVRTMQMLVRQAEAFGFTPDPLPAGGGPGAALSRLLQGQGEADDEALLGMPLRGARVMHVAAINVPIDRALAVLGAARGCLVGSSRPQTCDVLVRHLPRRAAEDRGLVAARRLAASVVAVEPRAAVGISPPVDGPQDLPGAAADAAEASAMAADKGVRIVEVEQAWADLILRRLRCHLSKFVRTATPVRRLLDHDACHGTEFVRTLSVWLANNQDTRATAAHLCIHSNTLRYRLRRAASLAGLDLSNPAERLVTQLILG